MGSPHEGLIRWPIAPRVNALTTELRVTKRNRMIEHSRYFLYYWLLLLLLLLLSSPAATTTAAMTIDDAAVVVGGGGGRARLIFAESICFSQSGWCYSRLLAILVQIFLLPFLQLRAVIFGRGGTFRHFRRSNTSTSLFSAKRRIQYGITETTPNLETREQQLILLTNQKHWHERSRESEYKRQLIQCYHS